MSSPTTRSRSTTGTVRSRAALIRCCTSERLSSGPAMGNWRRDPSLRMGFGLLLCWAPSEESQIADLAATATLVPADARRRFAPNACVPFGWLLSCEAILWPCSTRRNRLWVLLSPLDKHYPGDNCHHPDHLDDAQSFTQKKPSPKCCYQRCEID